MLVIFYVQIDEASLAPSEKTLFFMLRRRCGRPPVDDLPDSSEDARPPSSSSSSSSLTDAVPPRDLGPAETPLPAFADLRLCDFRRR